MITDHGPWQPIETSPRDREFILEVNHGDGSRKVVIAEWDEDLRKFINTTYDPFQDDCDGATRWMDIPE